MSVACHLPEEDEYAALDPFMRNLPGYCCSGLRGVEKQCYGQLYTG